MNKYVFDSGPLIVIFRYYYRQQFPSFWGKFDNMIVNNNITSTREVYHELEEYEDELKDWCKQNKNLFVVPTEDEVEVVKEIYSMKHYQMNMQKKHENKSKPFADPFIVARAKILNSLVVTTEKEKPNSVKIPNLCKYFNIECTDLKGFMEKEKWIF